MMSVEYVHVSETDSTSTLASSLPLPPVGCCAVVYADRQSAGRGQRGNSWESEPGKNLTFSMVYAPEHWPATMQFTLSMAVALGMYDALSGFVAGDRVRIKWPNDIYFDDYKISGILIENTLKGSDLSRSIIGIGLNVNQTEWLSDAPNPLSLRQITGRQYDLMPVLERVVDCIMERLKPLDGRMENNVSGIQHAATVAEYERHLWRHDGRTYPWRDMRGDEPRLFEARIGGIAPWGHLRVCVPDGGHDEFELKQLAAVL